MQFMWGENAVGIFLLREPDLWTVLLLLVDSRRLGYHVLYRPEMTVLLCWYIDLGSEILLLKSMF